MNNFYQELISRREFLKDLGLMSSMLVLLSFGGCESCTDSIKNRPIRRRISSSPESLAALEIYKSAIAAMKALPSSDPRNWTKQANIHGNTAGFTNCRHRSWFFFPWHRIYLFHFEQICRELTGEKSFGLPYWNWQLDPSVPGYFYDSSSQLYLAGRSADSSDVIPAGLTDQDTLEDILDEDSFFIVGGDSDSSGSVERTPHNNVHTFVGGTMSDGDSPLDPIFWTHHCMVDYVWYVWNLCREHDNPDDTSWFNTTFPGNFVDGTGAASEVSVGGSVLMPYLSYRYEPSTVGNSSCDPFADTDAKKLDSLKIRLEKGARVTMEPRVKLPIPRDIPLKILEVQTIELPVSAESLKGIVDSNTADRVIINLDFENSPVQTDFFLRMYINMKDANRDTGIKDVHYAGSIGFFGKMGSSHEHGGTDHSPSYLIDVTDTIKDLKKNNLLNDNEKLTMQLVAVPIRKEVTLSDQTLNFKNPELLITPLIVKKQY